MGSSVDNRTIALISGANQGLGLGTTTRLAKEHGYLVIIESRNADAGAKVASSLQADGYEATSVQLDLDSEASILAAVKNIEEKFGRLDVLVNNAGTYQDRNDLTIYEKYSITFKTNAIGTATLTGTALPLLRKSKLPCIVFVLSRVGSLELNTQPELLWRQLDFQAYSASKAALNMIALSYARKLKDIGGLVNIVCPGRVATQMTAVPGGLSPYDAAKSVVELATLDKDGPTMTFTASDMDLHW
ncbi:hypothetical protein OIDMADRAFT_150092 [Oidiodendron maius Zn]|uniref:Uncharacterized protein n=1 Tax=Oidiodendron maius (strain Zn) TaxID=913774 RepID=A0A0C3HUX1_OIDMZ|nr:hypothetical protein OIDMADRAFT_150092 [Oidiodendron maius Zn]